MKIEEYGFKEEIGEENINLFKPSGYPHPDKRYRLVLQQYHQSIEEMYFWVLNHLRFDMGYPEADKIVDLFAASEQSSFWGASQQRLGLQQDKAQQFLKTIGEMTKQLFQLVRELRILDQKLDIYNSSDKQESAMITLKGWWVDLVEGGGQNPASVYGLANQNVGFVTLPDLFYSIHPKKSEDVDRVVERVKLNKKIKEVLKRKLRDFLAWKEHTEKELNARRNFTLKYLRQHYDIIRMYIAWVKPYMTYAKRLQMHDEKARSADLIKAFEGAAIEIETLVKRKVAGDHHAVVIISVSYVSRPEMKFQQERGFHQGPVHVGRTELNLRGYAWTSEDIKNYKKYREEDDFESISSIDKSLREAMDSLGDDLKKYLEEAGEKFEKKKKTPIKRTAKLASSVDPFLSVFKGFAEIFTAFRGASFEKKEKKQISKFEAAKHRKDAVDFMEATIWQAYKNYKKAHRMVTW